MKMLSSDVRGLANCFLGFALVMLAAFGRFPEQSAVIYVTTAFGLGLMIYSLLTDFLTVRVMSSRNFLIVELVIGAALAVSPWLFEYARVTFLPQVLVGLLVMGNSLLTMDFIRRHRDVRLGAAREPDGLPDTWSRLNRSSR